MSGRDPSDDDMELFRSAIGEVERLRNDRAHHAAPRPHPVPRKHLEDQRAVLEESLHGGPEPGELETGDELHYARPGLQHRLLRRLRRGQFSVGAELDLHGLTAAEAHTALRDFLKSCRERDVRCVRIIHGKGLRSPNGRPVLKGKLDRWLRLREEVVAFCSARPVDGGTGAVYVLLRG